VVIDQLIAEGVPPQKVYGS